MASTNKTTNYNLSQFIGTDKPAWLSDYNQDMSKIDTGIHNAATTATGADGKADAATTAIGTLTNLTTTAKTDLVSAVNEVNTAAGTAQGTASSASSAAAAASAKTDRLAAYFEMTQFTTPTVTVSGGTANTAEISCASNSNGSLGKIYGRLYVTSNVNGNMTISFPSPLRPSSAITINGGGLLCWGAGGDIYVPVMLSYDIATTGTVTITISGAVANRPYRIFFYNSTIFATDFGDIPTPE